MQLNNAIYHFTIFSIIVLFISADTQNISLPFISDDECSVRFPTINTSFNVCNLKLPHGIGSRNYYEIKDSRYRTTGDTYIYHFNIGGPVLSEDPICSNITDNVGYCNPDDILGSGSCKTPLQPINGTAWAYQIRISNTTTNKTDDCWRLSNTQGGPPEWELAYRMNPADGVKLIYKNGDFLHDGGCPDNRKFTISFLCENEELNEPDQEPLYEIETCDYQLEIQSIYGCPVECKVYNHQLCNNEGLCGYDFTNSRPRCFCYDEYEGDDCSVFVPNENFTAPHKALPTPSPNNIIHTFNISNADGDIINITYDLTPMGLDGMAYTINDSHSREYIYYVGIFQSIDVTIAGIPDACNNVYELPCTDISDDGQCNSFNISNGRSYVGRSYAFQYVPSIDECLYLGTSYEWQLFDKVDDAARGVTINYQGGSWCGSRGINRGFRISLVCPDDQEEFFEPDIEEDVFVEEDTEEYCEYSMEIETTIACPYQCRTSGVEVDGKVGYTVCSSNGICAADPNAGFVRCLCDDGWIGVECDEIESPKPSMSPTVSPSNNPTVKPTRYPTLGVIIRNVTKDIVIIKNVTRDVFEEGSGGKTGGFTATIVILIIALMVIVVLGYFGYKKFKQREAVLQTQLDEYKSMGSDAESLQQDVHTDNKGVTSFTTIDQHIEQDNNQKDTVI